MGDPIALFLTVSYQWLDYLITDTPRFVSTG